MLSRLFTNRIQGALDEVGASKESNNLVRVIKEVDKEYSRRFEDLANKQEAVKK